MFLQESMKPSPLKANAKHSAVIHLFHFKFSAMYICLHAEFLREGMLNLFNKNYSFGFHLLQN